MLRRQIDEVHTVELQGIQGTLASGGSRAARKGQSRRASMEVIALYWNILMPSDSLQPAQKGTARR